MYRLSGCEALSPALGVKEQPPILAISNFLVNPLHFNSYPVNNFLCYTIFDMKIAILGTHSTGKTTLLNKLKVVLESLNHQVNVVPELARLCPFPINEETTMEAQEWIQEQQISQENQLYQPDKILLCDRSTLDNFAYFQRAGRLRNKDVSSWEQRAAYHMASYHFIFKTYKLELPATADGLRATDEEFRDEIDSSIHQLLDKHAVRYYLLDPSLDYDLHVRNMLKKLQPVLTNLQP